MKNIGPLKFTIMVCVVFMLLLSASSAVQNTISLKKYDAQCEKPGKVTNVRITTTCNR